MNRNSWGHEFYEDLDVPHNAKTARFIVSMMQTEGGNSRCNPLNCTRDMHVKGQTDVNEAGVKNYPNHAIGMQANVLTMQDKGHGYEEILFWLRASKPWRAMRALVKSDWGTTRLIYLVYPMVRAAYWVWAGKEVSC